MACISADGSLTASARALLAIITEPLSAEQVAAKLGQPLFKIRASLREMVAAGLIQQDGDTYVITEKGLSAG
jgi:DNA-binding IclR family transcriptional regulator